MLADDAAPSRAERHAHGHFPAPQRRPRDEKVRHVDAGDEQHADARAEHREEHRVDFRAQYGFGIRHGAGADAAIGGGEIVFELRGDRRELCGRLRHGHAWLEQADHRISRALASRRCQRIDAQRHPQRLADGEGELRRHDADDGQLRGVGANRPADDIRSAAVSIAPQLVPEQHDARPRRVVSLLKSAPEHRLHAERPQRVQRQLAALKPLGPARFDRQVERAGTVRADGVERRLPRLKNREIVHVDRKAGLPLRGVGQVDRDDAIGVREWQALEEAGIDDAEDGGAEADADAERQDRAKRERRVPDQHPDARTEITEESVHGYSRRSRCGRCSQKIVRVSVIGTNRFYSATPSLHSLRPPACSSSYNIAACRAT